MFSFSSISRDYPSLQAPCQIFVNRSVRFESSISRSLASDVQIHFIYLTFQTTVFVLIFITVCVLNSIVNYGRSERVIKVGGFDLFHFLEGRNVDISIFSKKIKWYSLGIIHNITLFRFQKMFSLPCTSRDYISLQAPCQIVFNWSVRFESSISRSLASDV
jgi:hypothetical protein